MTEQMTTKEESIWGMGAHLAALSGILIVPGLVLGPLAVWILKRHKSSFVEANAREAMNFQITILVIAFVMVLLSRFSSLFMIQAMIVGIIGIGYAIYAALQVRKGKQYRYPFAIRLIK
jgi:uncharacterized Tic20 family protein